ncbi:MAG: XdhC/CoxI family protein [Dehalococcoidia bacterium]|nr:XdhC/CoxI family protein [Dehalococcoidia bacterium]
MDILQAQLKAQQDKKTYALVTIVKTEGVTPRGVGSKMIVFADGSSAGTIGGGVLEKQVIRDAIQCIRDRGKTLKVYENRADESDSPCGGIITAYIEAEQVAPKLVVCGAGHVGGCLIKLGTMLGYHITAIDTRDPETIADNIKQADSFVQVEDFYQGIKALDIVPGAFYLVSTYGHAQDGEALAAVLEKEAAYVGMLGSLIKITALFGKLREKGYSEEQIAAVNAPVGLQIGGETPPEIALAIMAEMQMIRYGGTGRQGKEVLRSSLP